MTQPSEQTEEQPNAPEEQDAQTPVSDDQERGNGQGTHGRPSDDSDPGHS